MTKYIFCILACAFLVLGFSNVSNKELQGFQKKTETSSNDMRYEAVSCCCVSSAGFDKPGKDSHSQFVDETSTCNVSDCIFDNISFSEKHCSFQEPEVQYQYCHYTDIELSECYASGESFGAYRP